MPLLFYKQAELIGQGFQKYFENNFKIYSKSVAKAFKGGKNCLLIFGAYSIKYIKATKGRILYYLTFQFVDLKKKNLKPFPISELLFRFFFFFFGF